MKQVTLLASVNTPTVLGDKVFRVPYLSSGCPGTSDYNCAHMARAVRILWRIHSERAFEDPDDEAAF